MSTVFYMWKWRMQVDNISNYVMNNGTRDVWYAGELILNCTRNYANRSTSSPHPPHQPIHVMWCGHWPTHLQRRYQDQLRQPVQYPCVVARLYGSHTHGYTVQPLTQIQNQNHKRWLYPNKGVDQMIQLTCRSQTINMTDVYNFPFLNTHFSQLVTQALIENYLLTSASTTRAYLENYPYKRCVKCTRLCTRTYRKDDYEVTVNVTSEHK